MSFEKNRKSRLSDVLGGVSDKIVVIVVLLYRSGVLKREDLTKCTGFNHILRVWHALPTGKMVKMVRFASIWCSLSVITTIFGPFCQTPPENVRQSGLVIFFKTYQIIIIDDNNR